MAVFIGLKACQLLDLQEAGVFRPRGSLHSLVCVVKILKLRQNIKLPVFFYEILPTLTTHVYFPNNRLRPPGPGVGTERDAQRWLST